MIWLTKKQIIKLHFEVISKTGGSFEIRDTGLLDSAINSPLLTFDGKELYPSIIEKIARISFSLVMNHPFIDGNKRIGALCMTVLLKLNSIEVKFSNKEIVDTFLKIASGHIDYLTFYKWLYMKVNNKPVDL